MDVVGYSHRICFLIAMEQWLRILWIPVWGRIEQRGRCRTQPLLKSLRALIVDDLDLFWNSPSYVWKNKGFSIGWMLAACVFLRLRNNDFTHSVDPSVRKNKAAWTLSDTAINRACRLLLQPLCGALYVWCVVCGGALYLYARDKRGGGTGVTQY